MTAGNCCICHVNYTQLHLVKFLRPIGMCRPGGLLKRSITIQNLLIDVPPGLLDNDGRANIWSMVLSHPISLTRTVLFCAVLNVMDSTHWSA